jgi:hypothetical protein
MGDDSKSIMVFAILTVFSGICLHIGKKGIINSQ